MDSDIDKKDEIKNKEYFNILLKDIVNDLALKELIKLEVRKR